jgi:hypothetical protein
MKSFLVAFASLAVAGTATSACPKLGPAQEPVAQLGVVATPLVSSLLLGEALPIQLTVTNTSNAPLALKAPFVGMEEGQYAKIAPPSGSPYVQEEVRLGYGLQPSDGSALKLAPGDRCDFTVTMYRGKGGFLFSEVGEYRISVVIGFAESNQITIACLPVPETEQLAYSRFIGLPDPTARIALYDGRFISSGEFKSSIPSIEALANTPGSRVYASYAKFALAERELIWAERSLHEEKPNEAQEHMLAARQLMSSIVPGSALGHISTPNSLVSKRIAERTPEGKRINPVPYH